MRQSNFNLQGSQDVLELASSEFPPHQDYLSRFSILRKFVEQERELPGCCFVELPHEGSNVRIAIDMRGNLAHVVVGCPGEIWITLNKQGETSSLLGATHGSGQRIINAQAASQEEKERAVSNLIAAIEAQGSFVSLSEIRNQENRF